MKFDITYKDINYYFDVRRNRIKENILLQKATYLPKYHKDWKSFKKSFYNQRHFNFSFIDRFYRNYHIHIDIDYAFKHFKYNTYNENREKINGTLFPTLTKPFLVVKEINNDSIVLKFYKPFRKKNNLINIISLNVELQANVFHYRTTYKLDHLGRLVDLFRRPLNSIIYLEL